MTDTQVGNYRLSNHCWWNVMLLAQEGKYYLQEWFLVDYSVTCKVSVFRPFTYSRTYRVSTLKRKKKKKKRRMMTDDFNLQNLLKQCILFYSDVKNHIHIVCELRHCLVTYVQNPKSMHLVQHFSKWPQIIRGSNRLDI